MESPIFFLFLLALAVSTAAGENRTLTGTSQVVPVDHHLHEDLTGRVQILERLLLRALDKVDKDQESVSCSFQNA
jgi:hypothetical protein